jgi:hypothetical protein
MREQNFNKIKKTVFILLAVFLVISLTTTSASAWYSKTSDGKCKEVAKEKVAKVEIVKEIAKPVQEVAKVKVVKGVAEERLGSGLLDCAENNWFVTGWVTGWIRDCDNGCFGNCWDNCWDNC